MGRGGQGAAAGAVALGEINEAATLAFLFSVAEGLEGYAVARTRHGLTALLSLVPPTATTLRESGETEVAPAELRVGDVLLVRPGQKIATDGVVAAGRSALDTSVVTGESVPVEVGPGAQVFAGAHPNPRTMRTATSTAAGGTAFLPAGPRLLSGERRA
ncbi:hypothetical protein [Planotetraspora sp. A-T 1434]|uniref:P-type ATPase n=1 Tax=Planotetraspora sp. A-T 1434 TaxID=2979219 RepID=UPI003965B97D